MERLPNIKLFHEDDIANYDVQQKILHFYGLQGETYRAVKRSTDWIINYRSNAMVEFRPPWSDNFTQGQNGDLSIAEGCWTILFILFTTEEDELPNLSKSSSALFQFLKSDLYRVTTQKSEVTAAKTVIEDLLKRDPNDPELLKNIAKSPLPYVTYSPDIENVISTETIAFLIRIIVLFFRIKRAGKFAAFFKSIEDEISGFDEYLKRILHFVVDFVSNSAVSYNGFGVVLKAPEGWNKEIDLYNTYIMVKALTEFRNFTILTDIEGIENLIQKS